MRKLKVGFGLLLAAIMLVGMAGMGWGAGPSTPGLPYQNINVQGRLTYPTPYPTNPSLAGTTRPAGIYSMTFRIYNVSTGGTALWIETHDVNIDNNGVFNEILGKNVAINVDFDPSVQYYVGITISPDSSEMTDRQPLVGVPIANIAQTSRTLKGGKVIAGATTGSSYTAVYGEDLTISPAPIGYTTTTINNGVGVQGKGSKYGVKGTSDTGSGIYGETPSTSSKNAVWGEALGSGSGIFGRSATGYGVYGTSTGIDTRGIYGEVTGWYSIGVYGKATSTAVDGIGVRGDSDSNYGVQGYSTNGIGVYGTGKLGGIQGKLASYVNINGKLGGTDTATIIYEENGTLDLWITGTDLVKKYGAFGQLNSTTFGALGFKQTGTSVPDNEHGVYGQTNTKYAAIKGLNSKVDIAGDDLNPGVMGVSFHGAGIYGLGLNGSKYAIYAKTSGVNAGDAIRAEISTSGNIHQAIWGTTAGTGAGVMGGSIGGAGVVGGSNGNDTSTTPTANFPGKAIYALADGLAATNQVVYFGKITNAPDGSHAKYLTWLQTGNNRKFSVDSNGNVWSATRVYGAAYHSKYADIAEWIKASEKGLEAGDVVAFDANNAKQIKMSDGSYNRLVAGVISTNPSFLGNYSNEVMGDVTENKEKRMEEMGNVKLAIAGQVPCKVTAENGAIEIGDLLTTSNTPGYAMKATDPKIGTILGKAMESLASGKGKIVVLLTLQ